MRLDPVPRVSIPFIAGQWSLQRPRARAGAGPRRDRGFNPLHCGAVVASRSPHGGARRRKRFNPLHCGAVVASAAILDGTPDTTRVSIPFIAGQWSLHEIFVIGDGGFDMFQSPSLRGSGRFRKYDHADVAWSYCFNPLHCGAVVASRGKPKVRLVWGCFNPLHCGAVVASWRCRGNPPAGFAPSFNPLHCGAVVASLGNS